MKLNYRKDIDGLRAIAVLSVVLFHLGFDAFSGGFVGVDVFFVISGFLITKIIYKEIQNNSFSITQFYEKRIRRIFPVLFAVITFSFIVGFLFYSPDEYMRIGKSIRYTVIFFSNYLFAKKTGYFDTSSEFEPLLHTWSLAVEEQYYIVFPAILLFVSKYLKQRYFIVLSAIFIISLMLSTFNVQANPHRAFFSTEVRAWELILGSLLAIDVLPRVNKLSLRNILSLTGFLLILCSVFLFDDETVFPGLSALIPTIGSGLIIYSGLQGNNEHIVGKILSIKPMVLVGVISYSLYMWHWPLLVVTKHMLIRPLDLNETFLLLGVTGLVAYLSWRYIEQPLRTDHFFKSRTTLFKVTGVFMVTFLILCLLIKMTNGFAAARGHEEDLIWEKWGKCGKETHLSSFGGNACLLGARGIAPSFILWGDSHARAMAHGVDLSASKYGVSGKVAIGNGCAPLVGVNNLVVEECFDVNNSVLDYIAKHSEIKTIILAARWARAIDGDSYGVERKKKIQLIDVFSHKSEEDGGNQAVVETSLSRTVNRLLELKRNVVLVSQIPEVGYNVPSVEFVARKTDKDINKIIAPKFSDYKERNNPVSLLFDRLKKKGVTVIEPSILLCDDVLCKVKNTEGLLYKDDDHLSSNGAKYISPVFDEIFLQR
jgi:peptidoglycan/LPS O-acetylase OafA/YrhL